MSNRMQRGMWLLIPCLIALCGVQQVQAQKLDRDDLRASPKVMQAFKGVVAKTADSTVRVYSEGKPVAFGVVVAADGWIVTKASVLFDKVECQLKNGKKYNAKVVGIDEDYDLAALRIDARKLKPIAWRQANKVLPGTWVVSIGIEESPIAIGVVSVPPRKLSRGDQPPKNLNTNSGFLGVSLEKGDGGVLVKGVVPQSPAEKAGLKIDDLVIKVGGRKVTDVPDMIAMVQRLRAGDTIALDVRRDDKNLTIKATLARLPKKLAGNPAESFGSKLSDRRGGFPAILQHDTVIKPAECGGPIVDLDGKALGLNIARAGRTESYAIPSESVLALLDELKSGKVVGAKNVERPMIVKDKTIVLRIESELTRDDDKDKVRPNSFHKVHTVELKKGKQYTIDLISSDFDSFLRLEDAKGKTLLDDDDGGEEVDARIIFNAREDGVYRVIVTTFSPGEAGNYRLVVRETGGSKK